MRHSLNYPPLPWSLPARSRFGEGRGEGGGEGDIHFVHPMHHVGCMASPEPHMVQGPPRSSPVKGEDNPG